MRGKRTALIILSEGAVDSDNNPIRSEDVRQVLQCRLKMDARITTLGHVQRGGTPSAFDRILGTIQGIEAVKTILSGTADSPSLMISMNENKVTRQPLMQCVQKTCAIATAMKERRFEDVLKLRDLDFASSFSMLRSLNLNCALIKEKNFEYSFAVVHVGAPAGGMNCATRAVVHYSLVKGYRVYGVQNGFQGFIEGRIKLLNWIDVDGWCSSGGSQLGTSRTLPSENLGMVAFQMQKFQLDGLIIIGGFEAFNSLGILTASRKQYPVLSVPMIVLPATISNNVPGTEFSIGSDTALNSVVQACDVIKQSASASANRVFVIEVQGGKCGYLATLSGMAAGATFSYIPEEGMRIADIQREAAHLKDRFKEDAFQGRLIIRNEEASAAYTTEMVAAILEEESEGKFDARCAILGHLQQGGQPSPLDRVRGTRLAIYCVNFLESHAAAQKQVMQWDKSYASVIGIRGPRIICTSIEDLQADADYRLRRPLQQWWLPLRQLSCLLAGYKESELKRE
jgi:6-phosphofructokinase 1